jgi:hypothetical protein
VSNKEKQRPLPFSKPQQINTASIRSPRIALHELGVLRFVLRKSLIQESL